jgi:hypothetical protein
VLFPELLETFPQQLISCLLLAKTLLVKISSQLTARFGILGERQTGAPQNHTTHPL